MIRVSINDINSVGIDEGWNSSENTELAMHTIHTYPAKFPAFIAQKAFDYAEKEGIHVDRVADVFCGCGTVALESKMHGKEFWGCDINPVATLIARAKSKSYDVDMIKELFAQIENRFHCSGVNEKAYNKANPRLKYWFTKKSFLELLRLKESIDSVVVGCDYVDAFWCLFSSILKPSSRWLTKSIKPQVDPNKKEIDIWNTFETQCVRFIKALTQIKGEKYDKSISIQTKNFLEVTDLPVVDLIISSPPYVTSYEYADLHQLSSLWLEYSEDYRTLRQGSIGSLHNAENKEVPLDALNSVGKKIVSELGEAGYSTSRIHSVAKYYADMQRAVDKCSKMLTSGGMALFVVGDTEYKGVKVLNSKHLVQSMIDAGFTDIKAAKRRISKKLLTPYRDQAGRFSTDKTSRTIYHEEYIISGRMWA